MYLCILVLRTKIKSERFVFLPQFSRLRMEFYPLPVDNFSVLGLGCVTAIMSRGRELSGSWLPGTHQPVKVSQPLSSQLIQGATGDWGWLWADIWPVSPVTPGPCHVSCHILRCSPHAAGLRHCFLFFPRPGPGNSGLAPVSDLSASRGAAHCLQADEAGDQGEECLGKWQARVGARAIEQWSQETMDHIRGWAEAMMAWLHSQCWLTVDKGFSFKTITSTVHSRCPDRNPLVDRSSLGMMRGCPPSWWWPGAGPGQPCVPAAPCLGPGPCLLSVSVPLPASCSHHPRCFCWLYTHLNVIG